MNEASFSMNFHAYNGKGLPVQLTVRGETFGDFMSNAGSFFSQFPQLGGLEMLLREAPTGTITNYTYHIIGWMRGYTKDQRTGQRHPCVYLYSDLPNLDYKAVTVYEEDLPKLPAEVNWKNARDFGNQAPPVADAKSDWNPCDFRVVTTPALTYEGAPRVNKDNKIIYRFSHVVGMEGAAALQPAAAPARDVSGDDADFGMGERSGTARATREAEDAQNADEDAALAPYAGIMHDTSVRLPSEVTSLIKRVRELDKGSQYRMSVNRTENGEQKRGQYEFMCGIIDALALKTLGENAGEWHGQTLSALCGRPVTKNNLPGNNLRALIDELWPGSRTKSNDNFVQETQDTVAALLKILNKVNPYGAPSADPELPF